MRQEVHGCFAQMDRSLALPKIRARVLLQQFQTAWREAEFLRLDQALAAPGLQVRRASRLLLIVDMGISLPLTLWALALPPTLGSSLLTLLCSQLLLELPSLS